MNFVGLTSGAGAIKFRGKEANSTNANTQEAQTSDKKNNKAGKVAFAVAGAAPAATGVAFLALKGKFDFEASELDKPMKELLAKGKKKFLEVTPLAKN